MAFLGKIGREIGRVFGMGPSSTQPQGSAEAAMPYLNQIPGVGREYLEPYIQPGMEAGQLGRQQYDPMSEDPVAYLNSILQQYEPSAGYQYREKRLKDALSNTAAAGGYRGTKEDQIAQAELVNALMGGDIQQFLENVQGVQGRGLEGLERAANRGFLASGSLADYLGSALGQQAALQAGGAREAIERGNEKRRGLFGLLGPAIGAGVGIATGNPLLGLGVSGAFK